MDEMKQEENLAQYFAHHSLLNSLPYLMPALARSADALLNKTVQILMATNFDVIIAERFVRGIQVLCQKTNTPCVIQSAGVDLDRFDVNGPHGNSFLSTKQLSELKYRIYNLAFNVRLIIAIAMKLVPLLSTNVRPLLHIPEELNGNFGLGKRSLTSLNCLRLISMPQSLFPSSHADHYTKYLGAFVDNTHIDYVDNDLTKWVASKPKGSIIYVSFGSLSRVQPHRMKVLIHGLASFLLQASEAHVLLAFRNANYDTYRSELNELGDNEYARILSNEQRVKVGNQFVPQKWILQQRSIDFFISHCGMGSIVESFYFGKSILCMPLCTDQFVNAIAIDMSGVGLSLFEPPSLLQSLIRPDVSHDYTFSVHEVVAKLSRMFRNITYSQAVHSMSAEMRHAGGVKRAVEEIEFFVTLNGDLNRYAPFQSTLPFYQRYMLDLILIYVVLPVTFIAYLSVKCCKQNRKMKRD